MKKPKYNPPIQSKICIECGKFGYSTLKIGGDNFVCSRCLIKQTEINLGKSDLEI